MKSTVYALSSRDICLTSSPPPPLGGTQDCNTYKKVLANLSPSNGGLTRLLCESMSAELWVQCVRLHTHTPTLYYSTHNTHTLYTKEMPNLHSDFHSFNCFLIEIQRWNFNTLTTDYSRWICDLYHFIRSSGTLPKGRETRPLRS